MLNAEDSKYEQCNETHPKCYNCERRQITCDFEKEPSERKLSQSQNGADSGTAHGDSNGQPRIKSPGSQSTPRTVITNPFDVPDLVSTRDPENTDLDVVDLKLLHHFAISVAPNFSNPHKPDTLRLWQDHLIKLGFKHDFLLRGILAVAAYHKVYVNPAASEEYALLASRHQGVALSSFQETLAHVDEWNCHALFGFSCLLIVMTFASSSKGQPTDFNTDVLQWFHFLRGAKIVLDMFSDAIKSSFLKPLLDEMAYTENGPAYLIPGADHITDLFRICGISNHERETSQAYTLAIHTLLSTFTQASICRERGDSMILASFVWPVNLPPKFCDLLSEKRPEALVILAHYCVLIQWSETQDNWFIDGWGSYILKTIQDSIPEDWAEHLKWPEEMIMNQPQRLSPTQQASGIAAWNVPTSTSM